MIDTEKDLRGKTFGTVKLWEECRFTDQALLLASLVTGSVDLCFYNLERTQRGPAPCAGAEVLRQKGEPNENPTFFLPKNPMLSSTPPQTFLQPVFRSGH